MFLRKVYFDSGAKSRGGREDSESSGPQRRNSSEANSGDFLDLKVSVTTREARNQIPPVVLRASVLPRELSIGVTGEGTGAHW